MKARTVVLIVASVGVAFMLLWVYLFISMKNTSERYDSLKREANYKNFVDSLTRERNKKQLEDYLKKHPSERQAKKVRQQLIQHSNESRLL